MFNRRYIKVTVGRTVSKNFQSQKADFEFEIPENTKLSEGLALGDFLIKAKLTEKWTLDERSRFATTY